MYYGLKLIACPTIAGLPKTYLSPKFSSFLSKYATRSLSHSTIGGSSTIVSIFNNMIFKLIYK